MAMKSSFSLEAEVVPFLNGISEFKGFLSTIMEITR